MSLLGVEDSKMSQMNFTISQWWKSNTSILSQAWGIKRIHMKSYPHRAESHRIKSSIKSCKRHFPLDIFISFKWILYSLGNESLAVKATHGQWEYSYLCLKRMWIILRDDV